LTVLPFASTKMSSSAALPVIVALSAVMVNFSTATTLSPSPASPLSGPENACIVSLPSPPCSSSAPLPLTMMSLPASPSM